MTSRCCHLPFLPPSESIFPIYNNLIFWNRPLPLPTWGKPRPFFNPSSRQDLPSVCGSHSASETVGFCPFSFFGLVRSFRHNNNLILLQDYISLRYFASPSN